MNITLIGMPGAGKSYIGKKLAERLNYTLVDVDAVLEQEYHLPLPQILEALGEEAFLRKQAEDTLLYTTDKDRLVISTPGSIVYTDDAMEYLKKVSTIIYLETTLSIILDRIREIPRGIVGLKDKSLEQLYTERALLYEKWAHYKIDANQDSEIIISDITSVIHQTI